MSLAVISSEKVVFAIAVGVPLVVVLAVVVLSVPRARMPVAAGASLLALLVIVVAAVLVFAPLAKPSPPELVDAGPTGQQQPGATATTLPPSPTADSPPCEPDGTALRVTAKNIEFDTDCLAAPAGTAFRIEFDNQDPNIPHNVAILEDGEHVFTGEVFNGPEAMTYQVSPLDAGTYDFQCDVHPQMKGTFVAA